MMEKKNNKEKEAKWSMLWEDAKHKADVEGTWRSSSRRRMRL
jgi:hypothetical protein